jgi:hypothetical protein
MYWKFRVKHFKDTSLSSLLAELKMLNIIEHDICCVGVVYWPGQAYFSNLPCVDIHSE